MQTFKCLPVSVGGKGLGQGDFYARTPGEIREENEQALRGC